MPLSPASPSGDNFCLEQIGKQRHGETIYYHIVVLESSTKCEPHGWMSLLAFAGQDTGSEADPGGAFRQVLGRAAPALVDCRASVAATRWLPRALLIGGAARDFHKIVFSTCFSFNCTASPNFVRVPRRSPLIT